MPTNDSQHKILTPFTFIKILAGNRLQTRFCQIEIAKRITFRFYNK